RRARGVLRGDLRRGPRLPVVQRLSRRGVHGRRRRARARRRARHHRGDRAPGDRALHHGRPVRRRDPVGDAAGALLPRHRRQADLPHGALAPPLRTGRLEGNPGRRPLLDHHHHAGAVRPVLAEAEMSALTGKSVLVLGLGESGLAMARWCALRGARLRVADSRTAPPGLDALRADAPLAEIVTGSFDAEVLDGIECVALSPGLDPRTGVAAEARRRGLPLTGEMSLLAQALDELGVRKQTRILAITGTNGKTTTTALTAALARSA